MIGVFAFQGDFDRHRARLSEMGVESVLVKDQPTLDRVAGLVIPGGESTTFLKTTTPELRARLRERVLGGLPVLCTCAGVILLAREVTNPAQESLGVLDVAVTRNAYGRQVDSFIDPRLSLTEEGDRFVRATADASSSADGGYGKRSERIMRLAKEPIEAVFIRAPRISAVGPNVEVLARHNGDAVLVRDRSVIAATFHPELSPQLHGIHELFLALVAAPGLTR